MVLIPFNLKLIFNFELIYCDTREQSKNTIQNTYMVEKTVNIVNET